MIIAKSLNFSGPSFPHLPNGYNTCGSYLIDFTLLKWDDTYKSPY